MAGWMVLVREGKYSVVWRPKNIEQQLSRTFLLVNKVLAYPQFGLKFPRCSTTGKPTRSFATERVSLDSV